MQRHRLNRMYEPITVEEFLFAANLLSDEGSTTLELGEFILLELLRMRATTPGAALSHHCISAPL